MYKIKRKIFSNLFANARVCWYKMHTVYCIWNINLSRTWTHLRLDFHETHGECKIQLPPFCKTSLSDLMLQKLTIDAGGGAPALVSTTDVLPTHHSCRIRRISFAQHNGWLTIHRPSLPNHRDGHAFGWEPHMQPVLVAGQALARCHRRGGGHTAVRQVTLRTRCWQKRVHACINIIKNLSQSCFSWMDEYFEVRWKRMKVHSCQLENLYEFHTRQ